ncbi:MAG: B12-binding domain-containing radical SAM protein [Geobacter sp.]|nr:MAG: B12-binding domain-containing radical SAM protein [Geobacter sp.]
MLVTLVAIHPYPSPQAIPLANAFLKGYAANAPLEITLADFFANQPAAGCVAELVRQHPDAIGFSMYAWNRAFCLEVARNVASQLPGIVLFAGGPEATADPQGVMSGASFDFLVVGEGEQPFAEICSRLSAGRGVAGIPGVVARGGDAGGMPPLVPLADLDAIQSPYLNGILDAGSSKGVLWQLSRGCGFACDFCFDSLGGRGVRCFSLARLEAELHHFAAHGVAQVFVLDSTFNQDAVRAKAILRLIARIAPRIHFHFEVRSEFIDKEMAHLFARITCSLQIGLQSADTEVLKGVNRVFKPKDFAARIALLNGCGAVFGFDLMYGLPGDTLPGFARSLDFALGLYPNHLDIFPLAILPGTALALRSDSLGLHHLAEPPYTLLSSPTFGPEAMAQARMLACACDIFYTRGKAVAWFNGVVAPLGLKPSDFLQEFGAWLKAKRGAMPVEADLGDDEIWQMQREFLTRLYGRKGGKRLLALVLDLVDYHHHYAAALQTPPPEPPGRRELKKMALLKIPGRVAPSARLAEFRYEILDILEAGAPDVRAFADHFPASGSWAVIYPGVDGICTESISEPYYRFLEQLDGRTPAGLIAATLGIGADEARQFLEFAVSEGIVVPVC